MAAPSCARATTDGLQVERKQEVGVGFRVIGRGSFGTTYLGECRGVEVAVKCARIQKDQEATNFLRELKALSAVRHPNIMALRGGATLLLPLSHDSGSDWLI